MKTNTFIFIILLLSILAATFQLVYKSEELDRSSPHSDAIVYRNMAQFNDLFGDTHITYRFFLPVVSGSINSVLNPQQNQLVRDGIFAFLNVLFFSLGMILFWKLSFAHRKDEIHVIEVIPVLLVFSIPFFWRGAFLPLVDTASFFLVALILWAHLKRNLALLFFSFIVAIFTKEIIILTVLFLPLVDWGLKRYWPIGYVMVVPALLFYGLLLYLNLSGLDNFYLMQPGEWFSDWYETLDSVSWNNLRFLVSAFGGFLILDLLLIIGKTSDRRMWAGFISLGVLFLLVWLFTPENSPRIMFMTIPFQFLIIRSLFS